MDSTNSESDRGLFVRELTVRFGDSEAPARPLSFLARPGRVLGIIGPNGAGKSTLALTLLGVIPERVRAYVEGMIHLNGCDIRAWPLSKRCDRIAYIFQDVAAQLLFGRVSDILTLGKDDAKDINRSVFEILGLLSLMHRELNSLSSGESQKVLLATAFCRSSDVVVYDETVSYLDPVARQTFAKVLALLKRSDRSVILLGQRDGVVGKFCDSKMRIAPDPASSRLPSAVGRDDLLHIPVAPVGIRFSDVVVPSEYGTDRVRIGDLEIKSGETVALMGANGSGKSTLLAAISGDIKCTGRISFSGSLSVSQSQAETVDIVPHSPCLRFSQATCREELRNRGDIPEGLFDNTPFAFMASEVDPLDLSFGQQRILAFCSVVLHQRSVMLIDEPEQGLDTFALTFIEAWISENILRSNRTLVFSTHDFSLAAAATRCLFLKDGIIVADSAGLDAEAIEREYFRIYGVAADPPEVEHSSPSTFSRLTGVFQSSLSASARCIGLLGLCTAFQFGGMIATLVLCVLAVCILILSWNVVRSSLGVMLLTAGSLLMFVCFAIVIDRDSAQQFVLSGLGIVSLCFVAIVIFLPMSPSDLVRALRSFSVPVNITLAIAVAFRVMPLIRDEAVRSLRVVQRRRLLPASGGKGKAGKSKSLAVRIQQIVKVLLAALVPLMASLIRRIDSIVLAIDTQGYLRRIDSSESNTNKLVNVLFLVVTWGVACLSALEWLNLLSF